MKGRPEVCCEESHSLPPSLRSLSLLKSGRYQINPLPSSRTHPSPVLKRPSLQLSLSLALSVTVEVAPVVLQSCRGRQVGAGIRCQITGSLKGEELQRTQNPSLGRLRSRCSLT